MNHWPSIVSSREMVASECHCCSDLVKYRQDTFHFHTKGGANWLRVTFLTDGNTKLIPFEHYVPGTSLSILQVLNRLTLRDISIIAFTIHTGKPRQIYTQLIKCRVRNQIHAMCLKDHPLSLLIVSSTLDSHFKGKLSPIFPPKHYTKVSGPFRHHCW